MQQLNYKTFIKTEIPTNADIIFVADIFLDQYVGGAELTTDALIKASPYNVFKLRSNEVTLELLQQGVNKHWIFGNFANLNLQLIPTIAANINYSIIEYDYKYCIYRSPELHHSAEGIECNCQTTQHGQLIGAFMYAAKSLWWMSEQQQQYYNDIFPFLKQKVSTVLSSVFDDETFNVIEQLNQSNFERDGWAVLDSPSWVKGASQAKQWCNDNKIVPKTIWNKDFYETLKALRESKGFVYLPQGRDTCPRMVIEAKLLGCELHLNDNVQHLNEEWFKTDDHNLTLEYLYSARSRFWNGICVDMAEPVQTISGYTTTYNCITSNYPFIESITSMLGFCDQVVVVDLGSNDGTWDQLTNLANNNENLLLHKCVRDRNKKRWAIDFDGRAKALARSLCISAFCWQQDCDEIVHERDYENIKRLVKFFPKNTDLLCLPVIEYWGSKGKVRADIHNWKWRLSRNKPGITHGIPQELRCYDQDGELYAAQGTDSCDYIWVGDYTRVGNLNFYTNDVETVRQSALNGNQNALAEYQRWYNNVVHNLPSIHHYSWFDIKRKACTYKNHWSEFWSSMYNINNEQNTWFDKPWSTVTDDEILQVSQRLENEKGGWIFHNKIDWNKNVPSIECDIEHPTIMNNWIAKLND